MPKRSISKICSIDGCDKKHLAKGLCQNHYMLKRKYGRTHTVRFDNKPCGVSGCDKKYYGKGYCQMHLRRLKRNGTTERVIAAQGSGSTMDGYRFVSVDGKSKRVHRLIAEEALGHPLPTGSIVHHADCDRANNIKSNLVICQDQGYHLLLHTRQRALDSCGNANYIKCWICKKYDSPENMADGNSYHRECNIKYCIENKERACLK